MENKVEVIDGIVYDTQDSEFLFQEEEKRDIQSSGAFFDYCDEEINSTYRYYKTKGGKFFILHIKNRHSTYSPEKDYTTTKIRPQSVWVVLCELTRLRQKDLVKRIALEFLPSFLEY